MNKVCPACGHLGSPVKMTKGSFFIEIFLWLFLIVPGIVYTLWRMTSKTEVCPKCKNPGMIPLDSPMGRKLAGEMGGLSQ